MQIIIICNNIIENNLIYNDLNLPESKIRLPIINKLSVEFSRYKDRWEKLSKNIKAVNNSVDELTTTTDKITKKFDAINKVEIKEIEVKNDKN